MKVHAITTMCIVLLLVNCARQQKAARDYHHERKTSKSPNKLRFSAHQVKANQSDHQQSNYVAKSRELRFRSEVGKPPTVLKEDKDNEVKPKELDTDEPCIVGTSCGDDFCCCSDDTAVCTNQGLTYIPALPKNVTRLDFSNNSVGEINNITLENVTSLVFLGLEMNQVSAVKPGAFAWLKHLRELRLSANNLTDFDRLIAALEGCRSLTVLNVSRNHFEDLTLTRLPAIPSLRKLLVYENSIASITSWNEYRANNNKSSRLEKLDLGSNLLSTFPDFCCQGCSPEGSLFPSLKTLDLEWNVITLMQSDSCRCLPRLKDLFLGGNAIHRIEKNFLQGLPKLESLSLQFCMSKTIDSHAFNHSNIRYLDVSENLWFFDSKYGSGISPDLFLEMPRLQFINMSWTVFRFSLFGERQTVLSSISHVRQFELQGTGLNFIPQAILTDFTNLRSLSFSKNELAFLPDDTFENLTMLRSLDLRDNHLTSVSQSLLVNILRQNKSKIHLGQNPFSCTCDLLWFIEKYKEDLERKEGQRIFMGSPYVCNGPESMRHLTLDKVDLTRHKCMLGYEVYIAILFVASFALVLLIIVAVIYKFRWQLRFMLYTLQHRLSRGHLPQPSPAPTYDVFVSYDSDDSGWVVNTLQPELESRRGLKLCLHERDFTPGKFISHNIIEKMEESGAILPVLSNAFLQSDWCRFELFLAFKHGLQRSSCDTQPIAVLPVLLEELSREGVDSLLYAVLTTTTYLAWPGREGGTEEKDRFWNTLCQALDRNRRGRELGVFPPV